jgi:hypothetical protein
VTEDEKEDVSVYWMILRKGGDTGNLKRHCGGLALEGVMDVS